jgi:hypothetical protein
MRAFKQLGWKVVRSGKTWLVYDGTGKGLYTSGENENKGTTVIEALKIAGAKFIDGRWVLK